MIYLKASLLNNVKGGKKQAHPPSPTTMKKKEKDMMDDAASFLVVCHRHDVGDTENSVKDRCGMGMGTGEQGVQGSWWEECQ